MFSLHLLIIEAATRVVFSFYVHLLSLSKYITLFYDSAVVCPVIHHVIDRSLTIPIISQAQINVTTSTDPTRVTISSRGGNRPSSTTVTSSANNVTSSSSASNSTTPRPASTSSSTSGTFGTAQGEGQTASGSNQVGSSSSTTTSATASASSSSSASGAASSGSQTASAQARNIASMLNLGAVQGFPMDGGDLVLMEVGPHGITIDSLSAEGSGNAGMSLIIYTSRFPFFPLLSFLSYLNHLLF